MRKLRELRWELGSILPPEINSNLLNAEIQWFQSYNKSLAKYMRSLGEDQGFNLTTNMVPPKTPYVEVYIKYSNSVLITVKCTKCNIISGQMCRGFWKIGIR